MYEKNPQKAGNFLMAYWTLPSNKAGQSLPLSKGCRMRGMALPAVLGILVLMGGVVFSLYYMTSYEAREARRATDRIRAAAAGEAGYRLARHRIEKSGWENRWYAGGVPSVSGMLDSGSYEVFAQDGPDPRTSEIYVYCSSGDERMIMYWLVEFVESLFDRFGRVNTRLHQVYPGKKWNTDTKSSIVNRIRQTMKEIGKNEKEYRDLVERIRGALPGEIYLDPDKMEGTNIDLDSCMDNEGDEANLQRRMQLMTGFDLMDDGPSVSDPFHPRSWERKWAGEVRDDLDGPITDFIRQRMEDGRERIDDARDRLQDDGQRDDDGDGHEENDGLDSDEQPPDDSERQYQDIRDQLTNDDNLTEEQRRDLGQQLFDQSKQEVRDRLRECRNRVMEVLDEVNRLTDRAQEGFNLIERNRLARESEQLRSTIPDIEAEYADDWDRLDQLDNMSLDTFLSNEGVK